MRSRRPQLLFFASTLLLATASPGVAQEGDLFWGQEPPGLVPVPFAYSAFQDVYQAHLPHSKLAFDPAGESCSWTSLNQFLTLELFTMDFDGESIGPPQVMFSLSGRSPGGVAYDPNTSRLIVSASPKPVLRRSETTARTRTLWTVERTASGWSQPELFPGGGVQGQTITSPVMTRSGNLYYRARDVATGYLAPYVSPFVDGEHQPRQALRGGYPPEVGDDPWVDTDERFMLFVAYGRPDTYGMKDIYISYREADGSWSVGESLGSRMRLERDAFLRFPSISPDGKYLFFVHTLGPSFPTPESQYYWVSADILPERARR